MAIKWLSHELLQLLITEKLLEKWTASQQNQRNAFATSMDYLRSLIRIHDVRLQTLLQVEKLIANSMNPDQTAQMGRLVWIHAVLKLSMLVLSWRSSKNEFKQYFYLH
jgi:hypothetical protein